MSSSSQRSLRDLAQLVLAGALGIAHALAFAPWNRPWLQVAALAGLFALVLRATHPRQALGLGFFFGLGWFGLGVSWVYISMHDYGAMPAPLAAAATFAFCAYLSLFPALAAGLARHFAAGHARLALLALPAFWAGAEWLRGVLFTGFPWLVSGYAHSDGWLAGYAPLVGVYGITLIAALAAGSGALLSRGTAVAWPLAAGAGALLVAIGSAGALLEGRSWTQPAGAPTRVRLLQGNVPQDLKFADGGMQRAVQAYLPMLRRDPAAQLIVLPESAFPLPQEYLPPELVAQLLGPLATGSSVIYGVFVEEPGPRYFNSALGFTANAAPQRYSKRHLVPFGEFIPFGFRWFVDLMNMPIGDQQRGASFQPPMRLAGQRIAVNICYEDLFGAEIIAAWREPENAPTLLLNLSNLAWFNDSIALDQHLQISRLRALETGRPMLRSTNTGATAYVDANGAVRAVLPYRTQGVLDVHVQGYAGTTPFLAAGDLPVMLVLAAMLAASLAPRRAKR